MADRKELAGGGLKTTGAEMADTKVAVSEVERWGIPGRKCVRWDNGVLQVHYGNGGFRATTEKADGGVDDAHTGHGDADGDEAGSAMEVEFGAELAGSESRADVALKDGSAGIAAEWAAGDRRRIKVARIESKARHGGGSAGESWADVDRSDSDRFRASADQQTMAPKGASEQVGEARTSGRKADREQYDRNSGAEGALPDVNRPEPVERARGGMLSWMMDTMLATQPTAWVMPTSGGDMGGSGGAGDVADGVADGGMPKAYEWGPTGRRDRTWPRAEPMMSRRTPGRAVTDSNLLGALEGSLALPWMWG
jgi:hypothetical protein